MMAGDLPPSSSVTGVRLAAQLAMTALPVCGEPVPTQTMLCCIDSVNM